MDDEMIEYIIGRWETFTVNLRPNQSRMIINREFYVHWVDDIMNRQITFRDPAGNFHNCWVRNHVNIGLFTDGVCQMAQFYGLDRTHFVHFRYNDNRSFDIQIMDSNSVEVEYPILHNEPPAVVVPPAPNAAVDAQHVAVVPPPPNAAPNAQPAQNQNIENADVVGWTVTAAAAFVSGDNPLLIPAHVVEIMFERRQRWLDLLGDGRLRMRASILRKNKRSRNERYLGKGWYQFCRELQIQVGNVVQFCFLGNRYELRVSII
ncbi:DNA-binding barrel domain superfamily [Sesbania bispinosa]|nr:DNA-binding barrel domain superfamily [Sesbania bispinosa]